MWQITPPLLAPRPTAEFNVLRTGKRYLQRQTGSQQTLTIQGPPLPDRHPPTSKPRSGTAGWTGLSQNRTRPVGRGRALHPRPRPALAPLSRTALEIQAQAGIPPRGPDCFGRGADDIRKAEAKPTGGSVAPRAEPFAVAATPSSHAAGFRQWCGPSTAPAAGRLPTFLFPGGYG